MSKVKNVLIFAILITVFSSCSSIAKVTESWKADDFDSLKSQKILVVANSKSEGVRGHFEQQITNQLKSIGYDAVESYLVFPELKYKANRKPEEIKQIVQMIIDAGYNGVVVTKLLNRDVKPDPKAKDENYNPEPAVDQGYLTFGVYFNDPNLAPDYRGVDTEEYEKPYDMQTAVFNFALGTAEQLVAVMSIEVTNPKSIKEMYTEYAIIVAKEIAKEE